MDKWLIYAPVKNNLEDAAKVRLYVSKVVFIWCLHGFEPLSHQVTDFILIVKCLMSFGIFILKYS